MEWKRSGGRIGFANRWLKLHIADYQTPRGKYEYTFVSRITPSVVVMPVFSVTETFLLVAQFRPPVDKTIWQFPAGLVDKEEASIEAARRELREETGYEAKELNYLGPFYPDPGISADRGEFFLAVDPVKVTKSKLEAHESIGRRRRFSKLALERMMQSGKIRDGWTLAGLMLYQLWRKNA